MTLANIQCWVSDDLHTCIFDGLTAQMGEGIFAMFVVGIVVIPIYQRTGDPIMPATLLALLSFMALAVLPGQLAGMAWTAIFLALAIAIFTALYRTVV